MKSDYNLPFTNKTEDQIVFQNPWNSQLFAITVLMSEKGNSVLIAQVLLNYYYYYYYYHYMFMPSRGANQLPDRKIFVLQSLRRLI